MSRQQVNRGETTLALDLDAIVIFNQIFHTPLADLIILMG